MLPQEQEPERVEDPIVDSQVPQIQESCVEQEVRLALSSCHVGAKQEFTAVGSE